MASKSRPGPSKGPPPPLPPRQQSSNAPLSPYSDAPPSYDSIATTDNGSDGPWMAQDPRTSSTQSLVPSESNAQNERRKLLLIYIHGFMGNETSFRSFPAHVHNLLTVLLAETHVVHTKIYPRYRSKRNISFARDDFSKWLEPREDMKTDVVLLGHSMGGLLSAEVVLMPPPPPANRPLMHRILGTINFDVPFLGMHPGVVRSGLASIFKPPDEPLDQLSPDMQPSDSAMSPISPVSSLGRNDTLWTPERPDPNFNPSFNNDVVLPVRKGWQNVAHFLNKHSDQLFKSTKQLVTSHLEFGGAMANYSELKARYGRIRALEVEDEDVRKSVTKDSTAAAVPPRVRFVNYYTASTGRPKRPKSPSASLSPGTEKGPSTLSPEAALEEPLRGRSQQVAAAAGAVQSVHSRSTSPRISLEEHSDEGVVQKEPDIPSSEDEGWEEAAESLTVERPERSSTAGTGETSAEGVDPILSPVSTISTTASLPPIPDLPSAPPPLDTSYIHDADTRRLVEKEHARAAKSYEKAVKDREKAMRDRKKLEEKRERKTLKEAEKTAKDALKAKLKAEQDARKVEKKKVEAEKKSIGVEKEGGKETTQHEGEMLRLEKERQRMEAEGRRMRGEKEPTDEEKKEDAPGDENLSAEDEEQEGPEKTSAPMEASEFVSADQAPSPQHLSSSASPSPSPAPSASESRRGSRSPSPNTKEAQKQQQHPTKAPPKDRMFCSLPPKDHDGQRDPCWVRVFMANVDEVGAHCGLFFVDERYERLVGEVAERVEGWVREDGGRWVGWEVGLD